MKIKEMKFKEIILEMLLMFTRVAYINNNIENQDNNIIVHPVEQFDDNNNIIIKDNFKKHISCDSDNISLDKICIACIKNPIEIIFIPCKHKCYCNECKEKYQNLIIYCPICKKTNFINKNR